MGIASLYWARMPRRLHIASACALLGLATACGSLSAARAPGNATDQVPEVLPDVPTTAFSSAAAAPQTTTVTARIDLEASIRQALSLLSGPSPDEAYFLASNFALYRHMDACMQQAGLSHPPFLFSKGMPVALQATPKSYNPVWEVPPAPELARTAGMAPITPMSTASDATIEPNTFYDGLDAQGQAAYNAQEANCQASYVDPVEVTDLKAVVQGLYADFGGLQGRAWNLPGFEPLRMEYARCMATSAGLSLTISDELVDVLDKFRGSHASTDPEAPQVVAAKGVELAVADATCRSPIYSSYLDLQPDAWQQWVDKVAAALPRIEELRASIRQQAPAVAG